MGTTKVSSLFAETFRHISTFSLCVLVLVASLRIDAQEIFGAITGTVKDASGSAVPNATVTVRNTGTNILSTVQTKGGGDYTVSNLQVGNYAVTFSAAGF